MATFTVSLTAAYSQPVTVAYATADGTAAAGSDYAAASGTLTFSPGQTQQTVTVTIDPEAASAGTKTFTVNLSSPTAATIVQGQATGTILNATSLPALTIADTTVFAGSSALTEASFVVTLSAPSTQAVSVAYATADGTASAGGDYVATAGTLTFAANQTQQTITVPIKAEPVGTAAKSFTINLFNPTGATLGAAQATGTIESQVPSTISIAPATVLASSVDSTVATFTVTLSAPSAQAVSAAYATADGTAMAGVDYVAASATLTFTPGGPLQQTIMVTVDAAPQYDVAKTFTVNLSSPAGAIVGTGQAAGTIANPNIPPQVAISSATVIASTSGTLAAHFTVSLSAPSAQTVTVFYATSDGTARAGVDYVAVPPTPVTFMPGQTALPVAVTVNSEPATAQDLSFAVNLSSPNGAVISSAFGTGVGAILNPGTLPMVSINSATVIASTSGTTRAIFAVSLSAGFDQPVTVDYATSDGTATAGVNYVAVAATPLTFAPGQTEQDVAVTINPEPAGAAVKTFSVTLSSPGPTGVTTVNTVGSGTILAPGTLPAASINSAMVVASSSGPTEATFTVTLSAPSDQAVTVDYATADGTGPNGAVAGQDYTAIAPTMLTFIPGQSLQQTVTVVVSAAPLYDVFKTFTVNLSDPMGVSISAGQATGSGTIANPNAPPQVAISNATANADPSMPAAAIFTVTLSAPSKEPVTMSYATADGNAMGGFDYIAIPPAMLTFTPGQTEQTVTVTVKPEPADALKKFFSLNLSAPTNATLQTGQGTGSIAESAAGTNNHSQAPNLVFQTTPEVSISATVLTASPSDTTDAIVDVSLSAPSDQTLIVEYATADGTATEGSDYVPIASTPLTFMPGQTEKPVVVMVDPEPQDGASRSFTVNLLPPTNAIILVSQATITINDPSLGSPTPTTPSPTTPSPTTPSPTTPSPTTPSPTTPSPTTPSPTTPAPTPTPSFTTGTFSTSGKGKKKVYHDQLVFSAPLNVASAQNTANYHVTQKITKKKTANVAVLMAIHSAGNNSVTLTLHNPTAGKALQVMVSGLVGADGEPLGTFATGL